MTLVVPSGVRVKLPDMVHFLPIETDINDHPPDSIMSVVTFQLYRPVLYIFPTIFFSGFI